MKKVKNISGYIMIVFIAIILLDSFGVININNYKDYELSESELSKAEPIELNLKNETVCGDSGIFKPGFYDVKALGGASSDERYSVVGITLLETESFLNDIYISPSTCLSIDGKVELIPSEINPSKYNGEEFTLDSTTDLVVGENLEPGKYKIKANIPRGSSVIVYSRDANKLNENGQTSLSMINQPGFDNSAYGDLEFTANNGDVIAFMLSSPGKGDSRIYDSFPLTITKVDD